MKQVRRLAGTFVFLGVGAMRLTNHWPHRQDHAWSTMLLDSFRWGNFQHLEHRYGFVLWFIPSLFAALTLLEVARRRRSRGTAAGIVLTALAGTATLSFFLTAESIPYSLNTLLVSTPSELASYGARRLAQLPRWPIVILEFTALVLYSLVPGTTALNVAYFSPVLLITLSVSILGVLALYRLLVSLNIAYEFLKFFGRNLITIFVHRVYMYTLFSITAATDLHLRGFPCSRERGELPLETIRCQRTRFLGRSLGASP